MMRSKLRVKDYYDYSPEQGNAAGDIWIDLPTFGMLGTERLPGLVITPACDLSNRKVETITYLPILSLRQFFSTDGALPEVRRTIDGQLRAAGMDNPVNLPAGFTHPDASELDRLQGVLKEKLNGRVGQKERTFIERALVGVDLMRNIIDASLIEADAGDLSHFFGSSRKCVPC